MSFYSMSVFGFLPIGSLFAGMLASVWYFGRLPEIRRVIRPVYIEMGIMEDPVTAIEEERR